MIWYDSDYEYKKKITIDNTKVAGDEIDFPVLISVTDNDLRYVGNGGRLLSMDGYDIIFTNGDEDTQLKHEIEYYERINGVLVFWVKIPSLSSTPPSTFIYIYYSKLGVVVDPSTTDTWDNNFLGVYHLDDTGGACDDSTSNANDGAYQGDLPDRVAGKIGYGQDFDGTGDYITLPSGAFVDAAGTFECWFESDNTTNTVGLYTNKQDADDYIQMLPYSGARYNFVYSKAGGNQFDIFGNSRTTNFEKYGAAFQANDAILRIDKRVIGTDASVIPASWSYNAIYIGNNVALNASCDGVVDEVRISDTRRSNNWLDTTYETQNDPASFMNWGAEEVEATGADVFYNDGSSNIELQRDDTSPVQIFNGVEIVGLRLGETNDGNASPCHVFDGTTIKAILKMP